MSSRPARGNGPALSRRAPIIAAPAAGMAVMATPSRADVDPLVGYVTEHRAAKAAFESFFGCMGGSEQDRANEHRMRDAELRVLTTAPTSAAGLAAQIEFALEQDLCGGEYCGDLERFDEQVFRRMVEALRSGALRDR